MGTRWFVTEPVYSGLVEFEPVSHVSDRDERQSFIDCCYSKIVDSLKYSADLLVPLRYKNYCKFWWSEELGCLKDNAVRFDKIWKDAGRHRSGPIVDLRNADKLCRSSAIADAMCESNSCQLLHNSVGTTCTTSPEQGVRVLQSINI